MVMKTFEQYEALATQSRKVLFDIHIELQIFESKNKEYRKIDGVDNFHIWKSQQIEKITANASHRVGYLEAFSKGDFLNCDYHSVRFLNKI
jgi:hypothetical protein